MPNVCGSRNAAARSPGLFLGHAAAATDDDDDDNSSFYEEAARIIIARTEVEWVTYCFCVSILDF